MPSDPPFEIVTMGRVGVDLYPEQVGLRLADVSTFAKSLGGSPTNVAVAAAKLGARVAVITKVGDDPFGVYVKEALLRFGVDTRWVSTHPTLRTPLAFCEIYPPDHFPLFFYREPQAPDMTIDLNDLDLDRIAAAEIFWTTGTGLSAEPSRGATVAALKARRRNNPHGTSVFDIDYRPTFWKNGDNQGEIIRAAIELCDVVIGNRDEVSLTVGTDDPDRASTALLELGVRLAIVKCGAHGALARTAERVISVKPHRLPVVNGLGAGDAFGGALAFGLLRGWSLERTLEVANAAGAYAASVLACADAAPTPDDLAALVGGW